MTTHGLITEPSHTDSRIDHIGKGREGKGIGGEGESTSKPAPARLVSDAREPQRAGAGKW